MVSTKGKKKAASSHNTHEENEAAEITFAEKLTSDSVTMSVEEPKVDAQLEDKVHETFDEARNEKFEGISEEEEESKEVSKSVRDYQNMPVAKMNGDNKVESEENTSVNDKIDDHEDMLWGDDEEDNKHEERVVDEYESSEEEATEDDDEEDEVSEEEAIEEEEEEEEEDEENTSEEKEITKLDATEANAKEDRRETGDHNSERLEISVKNIKKSSEKSIKKKVQANRLKKVDLRDKINSSWKRKVTKRVDSMGMIFMCSSKTKGDCYQYRVLGLPESKKDLVEKIYTGMRLFLYDVDLKLMYGIYKAAGPGGYNIEPKAFKSQFPSQVRFKVLNDCLPLAEEKFKKAIKDNYYTKNKFDCQLNSEQVKKLCKLFVASSKGCPVRQEKTRRQRADDERRLPLGDEVQYHERPHKRPRKAVSTTAPLRRLPAPLPSIPSSYIHERTSDADAYRRDLYLECHSPYKGRRDRLLNHRDPYADRRDPPIERNDHYVDLRDTPIERYGLYRDGDLYLERHYDRRYGRDPCRDDQEPFPRHRDPYRDERDPYLELSDLYRDRQGPHIERDGAYRDVGGLYLERHVPYRDATHSELGSAYRRDQLSDHRDVYREDRGVEYRDSYRCEEPLDRHDRHPSDLETRPRYNIASRDTYVSNRERPSYPEHIFPAEYSSRASVYRL